MINDLVFLENVKKQGWAAATTDAVENITKQAPETYAAFAARVAPKIV